MAICIATEKAIQQWAKDAGLAPDGQHVRKVTVVIEVGEVTQVTVERFGDEAILETPAPDLSGVNIVPVEV